jgi:hypothetical protein
MRSRLLPLFLAATLLSGCLSSGGSRFRLPPASRWHAAADNEDAAHPASAAIDGDGTTFFQPAHTRPTSLVVDLSANTFLSGFRIEWGDIPPASYRILASQDALSWQVVYTSPRPDTTEEFGFFEGILARYVRVALESTPSAPATVREFKPLGMHDRPEVTVSDGQAPGAVTLFDGNDETVWQCRERSVTLSLDFRQPISPGGVDLFWGPRGSPGRIRLSGSEDGNNWTRLAEIDTQGDESDTLLFDSMPLRYLRFNFRDVEMSGAFELTGMRLRGEKSESVGWTTYAIAAEKAPSLYPAALTGKQPYRTLSLSASSLMRGAYLGADASFASTARSPSLQPLLETGGELLGAADAREVSHDLAGGTAPLASVRWVFTNGIAVTFRALAPHPGVDCPLWEADVENTSSRQVSGSLWLLLRPIALAPPWERGGFSPIRTLSFAGTGSWQTALVNDRARFAVAATAREARSRTASFEGGDVVRLLASSRGTSGGDDPKQGRMSGAWKRPFRLAPGKHARTVVAATARRAGAKDAPWPVLKNPADAAALFDRDWENELAEWKKRLAQPAIEAAGDQETFAALQVAHARLLAGPVMREWSLEEAASRVSALLRLGETARAKEIAEATFAAYPPEGSIPARVATLRREQAAATDDEEKSYDEGKSLLPAVWTLFMALEIYRYDHDRTWLMKRADVLERAVKELEERTPGTTDPSPPGWWRRHLHLAKPPAPPPAYIEQLAAAAGWKSAATLALTLGDADAAGEAETRANELFESLRTRLRRQLDILPLDSPLPAALWDPKFSESTLAFLYFPARAAGELPEALRTRSLQEIRRSLLRRRKTRSAWGDSARVSFALAAAAEGDPDLAREVLHDMVAGACPRGWHSWAEHYSRTDPFSPRRAGAMPSWLAVSEFVRTVAGLIAEDDNGAVWLVRGAPAEWLVGGVEAQGLATPYGKVDVRANWDGKKLSIELDATGSPPGGWRIAWPVTGEPPVRVLSGGRPVRGWDATGIRLDGGFRGRIDAYFAEDSSWVRTPD